MTMKTLHSANNPDPVQDFLKYQKEDQNVLKKQVDRNTQMS